MKLASRWIHRRPILKLFWSAAVALPLFQAIGCSLLDPQNLLRIGFISVLAPINDVLFNSFSTLAGGP